MASISEDPAGLPLCDECGRQFATFEELGKHLDETHRLGTEEKENPTNIGPGITERYTTD